VQFGIVGGGIGGLTAALALRAGGHDVVVFEQSRARKSQGVALLLWANAMLALGQLYVQLADLAAPVERTQIRSANGAILCELPVREWSARANANTVAVRRPDLVRALLSRLPSDVVRYGYSVERFETHTDGVIAHLDEGSSVMFDGLIGADGLHSKVRSQIHGDLPVRQLDQHAWVGLARNTAHLLNEGTTSATIGRGPRFWAAPLTNGDAFWYATLNGHLPIRDSHESLLDAFAGWHAPIEELIRSTRPDAVVQTRICDRPPISKWGEGPVTLLGDAAHASTPDLGQGACQAIESAIVLAECMSSAISAANGFRAYETRRMERTAMISRLCWMTSINSTIESSLLCAVRDVGIRVGFTAIARQFSWMVGGAA
jgi:2-polyprenyl-6-methoxyphenol hydroxylase-like FAD-dependent oxidoreductase